MNNENIKYLVALAHFPKFGPKRLQKIKKYFPSFREALESSAGQLMKAGIEENISQEFIAARANINPDEIQEKMEKEKIEAITIDDELYPPLLKEIYSPPELIFFKGRLRKGDEFNLAVVGSRKYTPYGKMAVLEIVDGLARNNLTITSGLALGIDALAHEACLKAGGRTIAVLGSGLDKQNIYPSHNRYLAEKIVDADGAVISEFPVGTPPLRHNFPPKE